MSPRTSKLTRSGPIRRKARPASATERMYGSEERRAWTRTRPCCACGVMGYSEAAHIRGRLQGDGGMSRKAKVERTAPLCGVRPVPPKGSLYIGCHRLYDERPWVFREKYPALDMEQEAVKHEAAWQSYTEQRQASA